MKKAIICFLILCLLAAIPLALLGCKRTRVNYEQYDPAKFTESIDLTRYDLVFCDEFEGELNREIWGDTRQGYRRDGYWTRDLAFTDGEGLLVIDGVTRPVKRGDVVCIKKEQRHALKAVTDLTMIEVQIGDELIEEDIDRFDWQWN